MEGIISSRNYNPGDVIYIEQAFAKVVQRKLKNVVCEFCCKTSALLRACMGCLDVKYCNKECQKNDWSSHKLECKHLKNLPEGSAADFVRLLGKVILKIKGKDWKLIKSRIFGKEFSFDDIDSHYTEMTENPRLVLFFNEMKELTGNYIGFEKLPDDDNLIKIIGKVRFSAFRTRSIGIFIGANKFSRECIPNSNAAICGNIIKIWAIKTIKKRKDKITFSSQTVLSPSIKFTDPDPDSCKCADCSLPYGESVLFKIIDKKRAFTVISKTEAFLDVFETINDVLSFTESEVVADCLLREQEGVLGDTNYLRMRLIAHRCLDISGDPLQMKTLLLKLERSMRSVFGEHYIEMLNIYKALAAMNFQLGYHLALIEYARKAMLIEQHMI